MAKKKFSKKRSKSPYDSGLEKTLHEKELKLLSHHKGKIPYVIHANYEPDFSYQTLPPDPYQIYIEVKGRFRTRDEARKYVCIKEALEKENAINKEIKKELIFIFQDAHKPMCGSKLRKKGGKFTHGEWAEKNGIFYIDLKREKVPAWIRDLQTVPQDISRSCQQ